VALKIFVVGFGLVIVLMAVLAFIMEIFGKAVTKYEEKKKGATK
jgi:Na+-transporting methylmalonyl-CoA/oxaloacetate decarboxylase gamma subunit